MTSLWTLDAMAFAMRADKYGVLPEDIVGVSIDSRTLGKGDAFFAIQGDNRDGHDFVDAALKAGAGLAVVARNKRAQFSADAPLLAVDDVLEGLRNLARAARLLGCPHQTTRRARRRQTSRRLRVAHTAHCRG